MSLLDHEYMVSPKYPFKRLSGNILQCGDYNARIFDTYYVVITEDRWIAPQRRKRLFPNLRLAQLPDNSSGLSSWAAREGHDDAYGEGENAGGGPVQRWRARASGGHGSGARVARTLQRGTWHIDF